jgi:hypothetical protein
MANLTGRGPQKRARTQKRAPASRKQASRPSNSRPTNNLAKQAPSRSDPKEGSFKKFIRWWLRPSVVAVAGITAIVLAVASIVLAVVFWWWPHSPPSPPFTSTAGGKNPAQFFNGSSSAQVAATQLILFGNVSAANNAAVDNSGPKVFKTYCAESHAIDSSGAYACIPVTPMGNPTDVMDPCFGIDAHEVICTSTGGDLQKLYVSTPGYIQEYRVGISAIGSRYPWRLTLANGMVCTWDWWDHQGHRWLCEQKNQSGFVILLPMVNGNLTPTGANPLNFNEVFTMTSKSGLYYAEDLIQGQQSTWTALLESEANPGDYQRVDVAQAWY